MFYQDISRLEGLLPSLSGVYTARLPDGSSHMARLPGTLDENQIGETDLHVVKWHPDDALATENAANTGLAIPGVITTRLTRKYTMTGLATFERRLDIPEALRVDPDLRIFLEAERTRKLSLAINGTEILPFTEGTLSTPWVFELTGRLTGEDTLSLACDNAYSGWPAGAINYSSTATDETQTNWNGIVGKLCLRIEGAVVMKTLSVRPTIAFAAAEGASLPDSLTVVVTLHAAAPTDETLRIASDMLTEDFRKTIHLESGDNTFVFDRLRLKDGLKLWDEYEGNLYALTISGTQLRSKTITTGIRSFCEPRSPYLTINGRRIFLRGETNCAEYPETGYPPMDDASWDNIMAAYRAYGVNCVRFHSNCPPEAAFAAADRAGMLCAPELSNWDPYTAFASKEAKDYYRHELFAILKTYGSHPSFVMLSLGNELHYADADADYVRQLLDDARTLDPTRLYVNGSNAFYGAKGTDPGSDFYSSCFYFEQDLRGTSPGMRGPINNEPPTGLRCFDEPMALLRRVWNKPVFAFEVGQYQTLPDFDELPLYKGVTRPDNLQVVHDRAKAFGLLDNWEKRLSATGELALLCYRAEYEGILATMEYSGISILGLQDFPGQGTALIGMMNAHLVPKKGDFAQPERFSEFFRPVLPLIRLPKYTYTKRERMAFKCLLANYGKETFRSTASLRVYETDRTGKENRRLLFEERVGEKEYPQGTLTSIGPFCIPLERFVEDGALKVLRLEIQIGPHQSQCRAWVYPEASTVSSPAVHVTASADEALELLEKGETVLLSPPADVAHMPLSIQTHFSTDHWTVGTYTYQDGYMGLLTDPKHPALNGFPTDFHSDWQWWRITTNARAFILPYGMRSIVEAIDCYARLRNLCFLGEFRVGPGKLMLSGMGLCEKLEYPEAAAMFNSILRYMSSDAFDPTQSLAPEVLRTLVKQEE